LLTLQLAGYTAATFGDEESASVTTGVAAMLACNVSAVSLAAVRGSEDADAGSKLAVRRLLVAPAFVFVDVAVDATLAGVRPDVLAASIAGITNSGMLAALRAAGLSQLMSAAMSAVGVGVFIRSPPPAEPLAPPQPAVSQQPRAANAALTAIAPAVPVFAVGSAAGDALVAVLVLSWCLGLAAGVRYHLFTRHKAHAKAATSSRRMPRTRLPSLSLLSSVDDRPLTAIRRSRGASLLSIPAPR
jgi:hypothetical protein